MRPSVRSEAILPVLVAVLSIGVGCAGPLAVELDEDADFSAYRTWTWHVSSPADFVRQSPEQLALVGSVARHVRVQMTSRGFVYARSDADLLVTPELRVRRRHVVSHRAQTDRFVPSAHASPNYIIEGLTTEHRQIVESTSLSVVVADRRTGRVVWRARLREAFDGDFAAHVGPSVVALMEPFPSAVPIPGAPSTRRAIARVGSPDDAPLR